MVSLPPTTQKESLTTEQGLPPPGGSVSLDSVRRLGKSFGLLRPKNTRGGLLSWRRGMGRGEEIYIWRSLWCSHFMNTFLDI